MEGCDSIVRELRERSVCISVSPQKSGIIEEMRITREECVCVREGECCTPEEVSQGRRSRSQGKGG